MVFLLLVSVLFKKNPYLLYSGGRFNTQSANEPTRTSRILLVVAVVIVVVVVDVVVIVIFVMLFYIHLYSKSHSCTPLYDLSLKDKVVIGIMSIVALGIREYSSTVYVGLACAVPPSNTNFQ